MEKSGVEEGRKDRGSSKGSVSTCAVLRVRVNAALSCKMAVSKPRRVGLRIARFTVFVYSQRGSFVPSLV